MQMKRLGTLLLMLGLSTAAHGQTSELACGALKAESSRKGTATQWSVTGPSGKTTETGALKSGPRFECLDGAILVLEFASTAGHSMVEGHFPDGLSIAYGRQQIDRRNGRVILPIQAKARIAAPYRGAFDYHCKLDMPADPIPAAARADCLF